VGFPTSSIVEDKMYYVPLDSLFSVIFRSRRVLGLVKKPVEIKSGQNVIKHLSDGQLIRDHPLFKSHPDALMLNLYSDAYETTNPLGSHTGIHKMEALYMIIHNFPISLTSKTNQIYTLAIWNALDSKHYGYTAVLKPVISMLKQLESENGLPINVNGEKKVVHGAVVVFSADNLGANSLFGFLESFSARKFCRFCEVTKEQVQICFDEQQYQLRSKENYDETMSKLTLPQYDASSTGIKAPCCLHELKYFHVTNNWAPDIMHDLLEGVVPFECSLLLKELENQHIITVAQLNTAVQLFNYSACDQKSKPPALSNMQHINMKAADMWCFLRILPIIIGPLVDPDNVHWQLFLKLREIVDLVFAPSIYCWHR
jgi:hypothetical protein